MAADLTTLRVILNSTNLQQKDNRLYQFLNSLLDGTMQVSNTANAAAAASTTVITGGVTGSGTPGSVTQWSTSTSLTNVNAAGISAALDLL